MQIFLEILKAVSFPVIIGAIILWSFLRPRKPKIIHSHMNKLLKKIFFTIMISFTLTMLWISTAMLTTLKILGKDFITVTALSILAIGILVFIYIIYLSQPFSRKRMGVKVVDDAIDKYKKSGERAVGIINGWGPDIVVDGFTYKKFVYTPQKRNLVVGRLAVDLEGNIVRSAELMDKIERCDQLAQQFVNPEMINNRTNMYSSAIKADKAWQKMLREYEVMLVQLKETRKKKLYEHANKLYDTFLMYCEYNHILMDIWMNEAKWGMENGNTQLKKIEYVDVVKMENYWKEKMSWWFDKYIEFDKGIESGRVVKKGISNGSITEIPNLRFLINELIKFQPTMKHIEAWVQMGQVRDKYTGLTEEKQEAWEARLAWVERVEGKNA
jgi:hypothetical protein